MPWARPNPTPGVPSGTQNARSVWRSRAPLQAIGIVLLPDLSRRLRAGDEEGSRASFNRGSEFALLLTLPAAVALMVIAWPIISVLFQRGAYGAEATANTVLRWSSAQPITSL